MSVRISDDANMSRPLILAIQPDRQQASQLASVARRISAELLLMESTDRAIAVLGERVPDLILTHAFLSHKDITALTERLIEFGNAAAHIQMCTLPILETAAAPPRRGVLSALRMSKRKGKARTAAPIGCEADTFAEQISIYLDRAVEARRPRSGGLHVQVAAAAPTAAPESDVATHGAHTKGSHCASSRGEIRRLPTIEELSATTPAVPESDGPMETSTEAVTSILSLACTAAADRSVAIPTAIAHVTDLPMGPLSVETSSSLDDVMPSVPETAGTVETEMEVAGILPLVTAVAADRAVPMPLLPSTHVTTLPLKLLSEETASLDEAMLAVPQPPSVERSMKAIAGILPLVCAAAVDRPVPVPEVMPPVAALPMRLPSAENAASIDQAVPVMAIPASPVEVSIEIVAAIVSLVGTAADDRPAPKPPVMMRDVAAPPIAFPSPETTAAADEHSIVVPKPMGAVESSMDAPTAGVPGACALADEGSVSTPRAVTQHTRKVARKKVTLQARKAARKQRGEGADALDSASLFDPDQSRFSALLATLDEVTGRTGESRPSAGDVGRQPQALKRSKSTTRR